MRNSTNNLESHQYTRKTFKTIFNIRNKENYKWKYRK